MCILLALTLALAGDPPPSVAHPHASPRPNMGEAAFGPSFGESLCVWPTGTQGKSPRIVVANSRRPLDGTTATGIVYVFSDGWGSRTQLLTGSAPDTRFGTALAANDSFLVVGVSTESATNSAASLDLYRTSDASFVRRIVCPTGKDVQWIAFVPDADGDREADIAAIVSVHSAASAVDGARVVAFSSSSGTPLDITNTPEVQRVIEGTPLHPSLGFARFQLQSRVELTRDGVLDLVGTRELEVFDFDCLTLAAFDGESFKPIWQWTNDLLEAKPGPVVPAWDVDEDGVMDLLVGVTACQTRGTSVVLLVSGATGKILASFHEP